MRRSIVYFVVVISMLLTGAAAAAEPSDSTYDGQSSSGPVLHQSHASCQGGETVLVIQDNVEWFAPDDPRGNVVTELIAQRLTKHAGIDKKITPHSLRHSFITAALDAGVPLRDVQEAASHADPRTTMRYDRARRSLDRHATYIVATFVAGASR